MTSSMRWVNSTSGASKSRRTMSLRYATPTMWSRLSSITGTREKPLRRNSDIVWRRFLCRSTKTTSLRGTITSRTVVSPSSKTEWIILRSSDSMSADASAMSTSSRSSVSVLNGPSRKPLPGVSALPTRISSRGSGPEDRGDERQRRRRPQRDDLVVLPAERARRHADDHERDDQHDADGGERAREPVASKASLTSRVTRTIAEISQSRRSSSAVLR